ncbi:hypothetical protein PMZ80_001914 [Knufia obscura]|uniref:ABM domain-containing protein n=1 Tax=Knufia obscura TaxID=1635080 RepID=A0ABR0RVU6_9EURO|nr:hypothetical protein PMZ80_001914 [Knufia obscura]
MSDPKNIAPAPTEGDLDSQSSSSHVEPNIKASTLDPTRPEKSSSSGDNTSGSVKSTIKTIAPSPTESDTSNSSSNAKSTIKSAAPSPTESDITPSTPHPNNAIALLCTLHPSSTDARSKTLSLLNAGAPYYRSPRSQCTTWTYFTPSTRPKAPSQLVPKDKRELTIGGMEIYTDKSALTTQQSEDWFREFRERVKAEGLYEREEELVVWYPSAGFVARGETTSAGKGSIVMLAIFTCKEGQREKVVDVVGKYTSDWVLPNEPDVLTYCTMTRPKAPNQVLLFERYKDAKALGAHGSTKAFKAMFKGIAPHIEVKQTKLQEWTELDNAFVGNVLGQSEKAKL